MGSTFSASLTFSLAALGLHRRLVVCICNFNIVHIHNDPMRRNSRQAGPPARSTPAREGGAGEGAAKERRRRGGRRLAYLAPAIVFAFSISESAAAPNSSCPPVTGLPPCLPRP